MGIRPSYTPSNDVTGTQCTDKYIGTAYDDVKKVADNLDWLLENADAIQDFDPTILEDFFTKYNDFIIKYNESDAQYDVLQDQWNIWMGSDGTGNTDGAYWQIKQWKNQSQASSLMSQSWANENEDIQVEPGKYSAKHFSIKSADSANASAISAGNAASSETAAADSEAEALRAESEANDSASAALTSGNNAASSEALAKKWAEEDEDVPITTSPNKFSALHHANKSKADADRAQSYSNDLSDGIRNAKTFIVATGTYPEPEWSVGTATYTPTIWFADAAGNIAGVDWEEGNQLHYVPSSNDTTQGSPQGSYYRVGGELTVGGVPEPLEILDDIIMLAGKSIKFDANNEDGAGVRDIQVINLDTDPDGVDIIIGDVNEVGGQNPGRTEDLHIGLVAESVVIFTEVDGQGKAVNPGIVLDTKTDRTTYANLDFNTATVSVEGAEVYHPGNETNPSNIGLGNVDNTSDVDKPISTAQQSALDSKVETTTTINGKALSTDITVNQNDVGLGNVDNTSDVNKPISLATQSALDSKADSNTSVNGQPLSTDVFITASDVGLSNVDNTSDINKPISTAVQIEIDRLDDEDSSLNTRIDGIEGSGGSLDDKMDKSGGSFTGEVAHNYNSALGLPTGTTAQRPVAPTLGEFRFNSTSNQFEGFYGGAWAELGSASNLNYAKVTTNVVLTANVAYLVDNTSPIIVTLPVSPSINDFIIIVDDAGNCSVNNIVVNDAVSSQVHVMNIDGSSIKVVWDGTTWRIVGGHKLTDLTDVYSKLASTRVLALAGL